MKRLYACTPLERIPLETPYNIVQKKPKLFRAYPTQPLSLKTLAVNVYWYLATRGKYRVWCAMDGERVVHTSYVVPKCGKFAFLKNKGDYEIGPCKTNADYRGQGIYPAVLSRIVADQARPTAYMIIDDANTSSIRGVTKCGFRVLPGCVKRTASKKWIHVAECET